MPDERDRIEPVMGDPPRCRAPAPGSIDDVEAREQRRAFFSRTRILFIVLVFTSSFFIIDRLIVKYQEFIVARAIQTELQALEDRSRLIAAQAREREAAQRRARAQSTDGRWLSKNCEDWKRAHSEMPVPTTKQEMERVCGDYEKFVRTGVRPDSLRRGLQL